jgi:hypothetical protein
MGSTLKRNQTIILSISVLLSVDKITIGHKKDKHPLLAYHSLRHSLAIHWPIIHEDMEQIVSGDCHV